MDTGKTIFAQLMDFLPVYEFHKSVQRSNGHYKVKHFSCWNQFLCMAFAQLSYRHHSLMVTTNLAFEELAQIFGSERLTGCLA